MGAGWRLIPERLDDAEAAPSIERHLADGEPRPALVVRLDPLVLAHPEGDGIALLAVDPPCDAELIRRCRLRMGSRLTAIVHGGVPTIGELFGEGAAAEADETAWQRLQETTDAQVRERGWLVRNADPREASPEIQPLHEVQRPVVVVREDNAPPPRRRRWGYLGMGILLVVVLKLLILWLRSR